MATLLKIVTPSCYRDDRGREEGGSSGSEVEEEEEEEGWGEEEEEGRVGLVQVCEEGEGSRGGSQEGGGEKEGGEEGVCGGGERERGEERTLQYSNHATVTPSTPGGKEEEEENETASSSSNSSPGVVGLSAVHTALPGSGTTWGQSPITLDNLPPTSPVTPGRPPNPAMGWWAEALAETQDMEDIDALVEQLEVGGRRRGRGGGEEEEGEGERTGTGGVTPERGVSSVGGGEEGRRGDGREEKGGMAGPLSLSAESEEGRRGRMEADGEEEGAPTLSVPRGRRKMRDEGEGVSSITGDLNRMTRSSASSHDSLNSLGLERRDNSARSSRSPSPSPSPSSRSSSTAAGGKAGRSAAYIVQAGRLIQLALQYEEETEYEEAFDLFKAAVDVLLNGVQSKCVCINSVLYIHVILYLLLNRVQSKYCTYMYMYILYCTCY